MDFALHRTIARRHGVSTTAQARDRYNDREIRRLVRSGRWRRTRWRGVLADAEVPDSPVLQVRADVLAVGPDLVACHSTAALLRGFDVLGPDVLHLLGPPQLVDRRLHGVQVHPSSLGTDDAVPVDDVWCTSAARTACDVVRLAAPIHGLAVLDAALRSARCTRDEPAAAAATRAGLRGIVRLRELVPRAGRRRAGRGGMAAAQTPVERHSRERSSTR